MSGNKESKISDIDVVAYWTVGTLLFFVLGFFVIGGNDTYLGSSYLAGESVVGSVDDNDKYFGYLFVGFVVWMLFSAIVAAVHMWDELEKERRR